MSYNALEIVGPIEVISVYCYVGVCEADGLKIFLAIEGDVDVGDMRVDSVENLYTFEEIKCRLDTNDVRKCFIQPYTDLYNKWHDKECSEEKTLGERLCSCPRENFVVRGGGHIGCVCGGK